MQIQDGLYNHPEFMITSRADSKVGWGDMGPFIGGRKEVFRANCGDGVYRELYHPGI